MVPAPTVAARPVPLSDELVEVLLAQATEFSIDLDKNSDLVRPVFPNPQAHDRWRFTRLLDRGVPLGNVDDAVDHADV